MSKSKNFSSDESWDRWNTHGTTMVEQEVFGSVLRFRQDPSSEHLGTTVWDASVNIRKGEFARAKMRGKKAIELGAGMGLAGMAFAMVGADVVLTDTLDVLDLLRINYESNLSPAAVRLARGHQHGTWADSAGSVVVAELDWTQVAQATTPPLHPPYDFVLAADCIYHETLTEHFHRTVMDITNDKSTVVVCNELRSHSVQGRFMELFTATHTIKSIPHSKMDEKYQHPNIFIYVMKKKKHSKAADKVEDAEGDGDALAALTCEDGGKGGGGAASVGEASAQGPGQEAQ
ncbi:Methyltransferase-like protein 21D, partial [Tetrabaena socialis]